MDDLKRQNDLLAETARLREDVERMTRHDLKSPIAVAMHGAQALLAGELTGSQRDSAHMIEQAAGNALEMINRTLDTYKMERGEYRAQLQAFDLGALLDKVARQAGLAFGARGVTLRVEGAAAGVACLGEPLLCYSLFNNALKNAAEASPDGGEVVVRLAPVDASVQVLVENRGEVPAAMRAHFFGKYAPSDKVGGHGLGTYSIRLMAEVQGGRVAMETGDGMTRLAVTLPRA
jgi:signal transduction histidine kinase